MELHGLRQLNVTTGRVRVTAPTIPKAPATSMEYTEHREASKHSPDREE